MLLYCEIAAVLALGLMLLFMPKFLPYLKKLKFGQTIYDLGPKAHLAKQGTPNMGGILIGGFTVISAVAVGVLMMAREQMGVLRNHLLWPLLFVCLGSMVVGFTDDYIKDVKKNHEGLKPKQKLVGQLLVGLLFSLYCYFFVGSDVILPFTAKTWDLGVFYIPLMTVLVMFMTNSANLQDGVDGILSSVTTVGMIAFSLIAAFLAAALPTPEGAFEYRLIAVLCCALAGACIGFLRFNRHPAKIFMGDTGSMFIGGAMVGVGMLLKCEFLLIPICFTCIMSSVSVMLQTTYFKYTKKKYGQGRRIFKMTPIHHHFELSGMKENQIVLMYTLVTLALSLLAIGSLAPLY